MAIPPIPPPAPTPTPQAPINPAAGPAGPAAPAMPASPPPPTGMGMGMGDPMAMLAALMPKKAYDVKIKRCIKSGRLMVKNIPPEDFLIDPDALRVDDQEGRFYADKTRMTRSAAKLRWPKKKDVIDDLPAYTTVLDEGYEKMARNRRMWSFRDVQTDPATEEIEIIECYLQVDADGDGVAEWRQICVAGTSAARQILSNEEWGGPCPYVSITPDPMPHRYRGRSVYDEIGDIQRVKTVLLRQVLDNLYWISNPLIAANQAGIVNKDMLLNPEPGGVVWTTGDPNAIVPVQIPFIGDKVFPSLEFFDMEIEKRTGVSRSTMALDLDTLQHQTATAVNAQQSAAFTKVETYARNIAECGGLKELFSKLLELVVENQKSIKYIKVQGEMKPMDPRGWNARMHVNINVGLGAGSRDRDMQMLGGIAAKQEQAIMALGGPSNPVLNLSHAFTTYRKMVETSGIKSPEMYFPEITNEQVAQFAANQPKQPPPEVMKLQGQMQIEQMKLQAEQQRDQNRYQLDQAQSGQKAQIEQIQAQADIATQERKTSSEIFLAEKRFELERELKLLEHEMKMREGQVNMAQQHAAHQQTMAQQQAAHQQEYDSTLLGAMADHAKRREQTQASSKQAEAAAAEKKEQASAAAFSMLADSMKQFAESLNAPTEIVRDPRTNRVVGSRKVVAPKANGQIT